MGFIKKVGKGLKKGVKKVVKAPIKVGKTAVKVVKKTGDFVVDVALFLPLLPFKIAMKHAVLGKGINPSNDNSKLVGQFLKHVLGKNNIEFIDPVITPALINLVINYFKNLKTKKLGGGILSKNEEKLLQLSDEGINEFKGAIVEKSDNITGAFIRENIGKIVGSVVVLIVVIILFKKFGSNK